MPANESQGTEKRGNDGRGDDVPGDDAALDDADISAAGSTVRTVVITAREDLQIAREARRVLGAQ